MSVLHNKVSHLELREKLAQETFPRITISFYKYHTISDPTALRNELFAKLESLQVFGRIYIATEGINAQISVPEHHFQDFKAYINSISFLENNRLNIAVDESIKSFFVLKIKVRNKIVADGLNDPTFDASHTGKYLKAQEYNTLSQQEDTIVVDMRNHYEYEVGRFENAIEIPSDTFREQLPMAVDMLQDKKDKNIIMYCTGGIRCEKASAYMLHHGFKNVYHIEGGIINYVQTAKNQNIPVKFIGKNFVFDERLGERISNDIIAKCHQCGKPADTHTNCKNNACHLLFIQCEECAKTYDGCCTEACTTTYHLPEEEQKALRAGLQNDQKIFNKSKQRLRPKLNEVK